MKTRIRSRILALFLAAVMVLPLLTAVGKLDVKATGSLLWPVDEKYQGRGLSYKEVYNGDPHRGIDINGSGIDGAAIYAVADGVVQRAQVIGGYGNCIVLKHSSLGIYSLYAHCSSLVVSSGATVSEGDVIAYVGSTGDSTGAHLHFELMSGYDLDTQNTLIDPTPGVNYNYYYTPGGTPHILSMTFNANGGTISSGNYYVENEFVYKKSDSSVLVDQWKYNAYYENGLYNAATFGLAREGYTFLGWSLSQDGSTTVFDQDDNTLRAQTICPALEGGDQSVVLYAIWERALGSCFITYDANGGTGAPATQYYSFANDGAIDLPSTIPTREGYTFLGWSQDQNATQARYTAGQSWFRSNNGDFLLYAVWDAIGPENNVEFSDWMEDIPFSITPDQYDIETKTVYRYCDQTSETVYGDWTSAGTTDTRPTESDTLRITGTTTYYNYYHYCCNWYNNEWNVDSIPYGSGYHYYHTISLDHTLPGFSFSDRGGKQAYNDGHTGCADRNWTVWFLDGTTTRYTYETRTKTTDQVNGAWSSWSDTAPTAETGRTIEQKTLKRYKLKEDVHEHTWSEGIVTAPTCTAGGYTTYTCTVCGETYTTDETPANGHAPGEWIIDQQASLGAAGSKHKECTVCHAVLETESIPALEEPAPVDPDAPQIVVDSKTVNHGREFVVNVTVKNNPGVMAMTLIPDFSDALTLVKAANGTLLSDYTAGRSFFWTANEDVTEDGVLLTLTFTTAEDLEPADYTVTFRLWDSSDSEENDVSFAVVPGVITVTDITWGDANGDGNVNNKDIVRLKKYFANYDDITNTSTEEIFPGADANGDGIVNNKDIVRLKNFFANLDSVTGLSTVILGPAA